MATPSKVAMHPNELLQTKINDRVGRSKTQGMHVTPHRCMSVLKVTHITPKGVSTNAVLMGLHRGITFFDNDHVRASKTYTPKGGGNLKFTITKGTALFDRLPGLIPVACTCMDYLRRCTTGEKGVPSVNVETEPHSEEYTAMGAVMGCKHMISAQEWVTRDPAAAAYFAVE